MKPPSTASVTRPGPFAEMLIDTLTRGTDQATDLLLRQLDGQLDAALHRLAEGLGKA